MAHLPVRDSQLTCIFSQGVMEHFKDPIPYFKEQIRILQKGGYLVVNVPQKFTGYTLYKHAEMRRNKWNLGWETEFSASRLSKMGHQLRLQRIQVMGYNYWRSRREPCFVLRDTVDKFYRLFHFPKTGLLGIPKSIYDQIWKLLERKWGHLFMQNLVILFKK